MPSDEVPSIMCVLEGFYELECQARRDEVSDGAVDAGAIRTDVQDFLDARLREPRLKEQSGDQIIGKPTDRCSNHESTQIPPDNRLARTLS